MKKRNAKEEHGRLERYGTKTFAAIMLLILLSILDAYLTLDLVNHGAVELNPVMAYYLARGPLAFFWVKYLLTCAAVILFLSVMNTSLFGTRIRGKVMFVFFLAAFAVIVQYELFLVFIAHK
jgi:hypothetical protein